MIPERYLASSATTPDTIAGPTTEAVAVASVALIKEWPLEGLNVLLLEDNLIVALEAEELLQALGASSVAMVSSTAVAAKVHSTSQVDFAVLDVNLGFESRLGFAAVLRAADAPFIFASGYGAQIGSEGVPFRELTVTKPYDRDFLGVAITNTLASTRSPDTKSLRLRKVK